MDITPAAQRILEERYYLPGESKPEQMFKRIAVEVASVEEERDSWTDTFYEMMTNKEFIPNSPTIMNAGTEMNNLSACFVLPIADDLALIYETLKQAALIFKSGGGCGFSFSKLRPRGDLVKKSGGRSSGPVSFMTDFDRMAETVEQGGRRRGAMLGSLSVHHPDIMKFISAKRDEGILSNFNISVEVTDEFLEAVKERKDYELRNPRGGHPNDPENKMVVRRINAPAVFNEICKGIWLNGEPGILFVDKINKDNDYEFIGDYNFISTTNPSLRSGTKILTSNGIFAIENLEGEKIKTATPNAFGEVEFRNAFCQKSGRNKRLYKVILEGNHEYYCTPEHKWAIVERKGYGNYGRRLAKKKTEDLKKGDWLYKSPFLKNLGFGELGDYTDGLLAGYLYGDGWITKANDGATQIGFIFGTNSDLVIRDKILPRIERITNRKYTHNKEINIRNRKLIEYLQKFGIGKKELGLPSAIWTVASEDFRKGLIDGLFSADSHVDEERKRLVLTCSRKKLIDDVSDLLGFYGVKNAIYKSMGTATLSNNKKVDYTRYDLTISVNGIEDFKGIFTLSNTSKNQSLNKIEGGNKKKVYDFYRVKEIYPTDIFEDVWDITVDDSNHTFEVPHVVSGNCGEQPLPDYGSCNLGHINLSKFVQDGEVDWEGIEEIVRKGVRFLDDVISVGKFPLPAIEERAKRERRIGLGVMGWHEALLKLGLRYGGIESIQLAGKMAKFIRAEAKLASNGRNKRLLTVAPTGTTAMILGTTYGIEPIHQISERKEVLGGEILANPNPAVQEILTAGDTSAILVTAPEISPKRHIDMQAAWQEHVDASISKTINLPRDFSEEQIGEEILYGWEKGLKGMTMYRAGSRVGEPIKTENTKKLPRRPRKLVGNTYREPLSCGRTLYPTITKDETGRVQEIFIAGLGKVGDCITAWAESFSRAASLYLRTGGDPNRLIGTLRGIGCPEGRDSCPNMIAKILEEETKRKDEEKNRG